MDAPTDAESAHTSDLGPTDANDSVVDRSFSFHRLVGGDGHVCVIRGAENRVYCYGRNDWGQLGIGSSAGTEPGWQSVIENLPDSEASSGPFFVGAVSLMAGPSDNCALRGSDLYCWGYGTLAQLAPASVRDDRGIVNRATRAPWGNVDPGSIYEIASGYSHLCMRAEKGTFCWGDNSGAAVSGQILQSIVSITTVPGLPAVSRLALGHQFSLAVLASDDSVLCWGFGALRQCGSLPATDCPYNETKHCAISPMPIDGLPPARVVAAGNAHACAIGVDGKVRCWGTNEYSQTGTRGTQKCTLLCQVAPVVVSLVDGADQLALGSLHSCALLKNEVWCWGELAHLGRGLSSVESDPNPAPVLLEDGTHLTNVVEIASSDFWTCARTDKDDVYCWGQMYGPVFPSARPIPWPSASN